MGVPSVARVSQDLSALSLGPDQERNIRQGLHSAGQQSETQPKSRTLNNDYENRWSHDPVMIEDGVHYGNQAPPYVCGGYVEHKESFVAVLADCDTQIQVHPWPFDHGRFHWFGTIDGKRRPLIKTKGRSKRGPCGLKAWYGYRPGFGKKTVAYFDPTTTVTDPFREAFEPPYTSYTTANKAQANRESSERTLSNRAVGHRQLVRQLHDLYGADKPPFLQSKNLLKKDGTKTIVKATSSGQYPKPEDVPAAMAVAESEDRKKTYFFWSIDTPKERLIVAPFRLDGKTVYLHWRGEDEGFGKTPVAYDLVERAAEDQNVRQVSNEQATTSHVEEVPESTHTPFENKTHQS
ncbi:MAG: hypothetical protein LQ352_004412 [Teloschistes flavicans]|nr:MAG: hypothetical protein LQ352_004412 [Teloschistes flavicans]